MSGRAGVLIVAEHDGTALNSSTAKCVSCARELQVERVEVAVFGAEAHGPAEQAAGLAGVGAVLHVECSAADASLAATLAPQVAELAGAYTHVLGPSTTFGKDLMPRVAALLGVGQISDVMAVEGSYRFRRPVYAGNAVVTVETRGDQPRGDQPRGDQPCGDQPLVATVRTASYPAAVQTSSRAPVEQRRLTVDLPRHSRLVELRAGSGERPDLQTAARVVSGGRALGSAEGFGLIYTLADRLGAAVGASRAAVDAGFVANDLQVGQTGKIIAPSLYFAIGISGAIQHATGIKDAGTIVAINKDADAPIFEIADVGLVADLFEAVPALIAALGE